MEIIARATIVFWLVFLLTRGLKRRSLADMAPFEMILLVVLGDIIQQGVMQQDYSVTGAFLALSTFGFWITVMTFITWRWRRVRHIMEGVPIVLVADGKPIDSGDGAHAPRRGSRGGASARGRGHQQDPLGDSRGQRKDLDPSGELISRRPCQGCARRPCDRRFELRSQRQVLPPSPTARHRPHRRGRLPRR